MYTMEKLSIDEALSKFFVVKHECEREYAQSSSRKKEKMLSARASHPHSVSCTYINRGSNDDDDDNDYDRWWCVSVMIELLTYVQS